MNDAVDIGELTVW